MDGDGDGQVDSWSHYRGGVITRLERDADGDGFRDLVAFYREGRLDREERDEDADGAVDLIRYYDAGERVERVEEDADGDGQMDVVSHYEGGRLTRREVLDASVLDAALNVPRTPLQGMAFLLGLWLALSVAPWASAESAAPFAALEQDLHRAVNGVRAQQHMIALERRADLDAVARAHSLDMVRRHYFAHHSPEGADALARLEGAGVDGFTLAAENLGITDRPDPTREIVQAWLASEVHRRNLFVPPFNATGIGIARAPNGSLVYTQLYVTYPR